VIARKPLLLVVVGLIVVLAVAVFAPSAFANQVTKIMYAQENTTVYTYTPASTGTFHCTLSWGSGGPVYPASEVDGGIWGYDATTGDLFMDQDSVTTVPYSFFGGTNPEVADWVDTDAAHHPVYFGVMPYEGDVTATLTVTFQATGSPTATTIIDHQTSTCSASDGTAFVPNTGTWHSSRQFWAGNAATAYACWNDYSETRVAESSSAHTGPYMTYNDDPTIWYPDAVTSLSTDTTIVPAGSSTTSSVIGQAPMWYVIAPEIWPSLATGPNVWSVPPGANEPNDGKPATMAATVAPLWYTYSYPDSTVTTNKPAYLWPTTTVGAASKRNFCSDPTTGSTISFKFYGASVTWVFIKGPGAGFAKITIDGVAPASNATVDTYAAAITYGQTMTWSGLNATHYHTIVITSNKTKNASSTGFFTYTDAFQAKTDPDMTGLMGANYREENNYDGSTSYTWNVTNWGSASGGNFSSTKSATAATAFTFTGPSITWHYIKTASGGIERVSIDGMQVGTVDMWAAANTAAAVSYNVGGDSGAMHTILCTGTGQKNGSSTGFWQYSDAWQVGSNTYQN
jgi:hypothetical protein